MTVLIININTKVGLDNIGDNVTGTIDGVYHESGTMDS